MNLQQRSGMAGDGSARLLSPLERSLALMLRRLGFPKARGRRSQ
jgi:hypothetical protein